MTHLPDTNSGDGKYFIGIDPATGRDDRTVLTMHVAVPVPQIKRFSRWRVFLALFNPKSHFTTCDTLMHELRAEQQIMLESQLRRYRP